MRVAGMLALAALTLAGCGVSGAPPASTLASSGATASGLLNGYTHLRNVRISQRDGARVFTATLPLGGSFEIVFEAEGTGANRRVLNIRSQRAKGQVLSPTDTYLMRQVAEGLGKTVEGLKAQSSEAYDVAALARYVEMLGENTRSDPQAAVALFQVLDRNKDGRLDYPEFSGIGIYGFGRGLTALGRKASVSERCAYSFSSLDTDRDGSLRWAEVYWTSDEALGRAQFLLFDVLSSNDQVIAQVDGDGDKALAVAEWRWYGAFLTRLVPGTPAGEHAAELSFRTVDANRDGRITAVELKPFRKEP